ncbi:MAG: hypothetical protein ACREYC_21225 [Gammaproteobacteria bacterium]
MFGRSGASAGGGLAIVLTGFSPLGLSAAEAGEIAVKATRAATAALTIAWECFIYPSSRVLLSEIDDAKRVPHEASTNRFCASIRDGQKYPGETAE